MEMSYNRVCFLAAFLLYTLYYRYTIRDVFSCGDNPFPDDCCCEVYSGVICLRFPISASKDCYAMYEEAMVARAKVTILMDLLIGVSLLWLMWEIYKCFNEFNGRQVTSTNSYSTDSSPPKSPGEERRKLILQHVIHSKVPRRSNDLIFSYEKTSLLRSIPNTLPVIIEDVSIESLTANKENYEERLETSFKDACPVCLEDYIEGDDVAWSRGKCSHVFHLGCIQDWLMESDECPMCRVNFFKEEGGGRSVRF